MFAFENLFSNFETIIAIEDYYLLPSSSDSTFAGLFFTLKSCSQPKQWYVLLINGIGKPSKRIEIANARPES